MLRWRMKATRTLRARLAVVDQEVGADVQLAVVFLVEAGRFLEVVVDGVARDRQAEVLGDPALFLVGRRVEVDPDRLRRGPAPAWLSISSWKSRPLASVKTFSMKAPASMTRSPERTVTEGEKCPRTASRRCGDEIIASARRARRTARNGVRYATAIDWIRAPLRTTLFTRQASARSATVSCRTPERILMNLTISGHHLDVTPAMREYVLTKLDRITRHFDQVVDITVLLSVEKLSEKERRQKAEVTSRQGQGHLRRVHVGRPLRRDRPADGQARPPGRPPQGQGPEPPPRVAQAHRRRPSTDAAAAAGVAACRRTAPSVASTAGASQSRHAGGAGLHNSSHRHCHRRRRGSPAAAGAPVP